MTDAGNTGNVTLMLRGDSPTPEPKPAKLTDAECERLAEEVFDKVIGPSIPREWQDPLMQRRMDQYEKIGVFPPPPLMLVNGLPVYLPGELVDERRRAIDREYIESLKKLERDQIITFLRNLFLRENYSKKHWEELFSGYASAYWWQINEELEKHIFAIKKGRRTKADLSDYPKIAALGDKLIPVCTKLLTELEAGTKHSVKEILEFTRSCCIT